MNRPSTFKRLDRPLLSAPDANTKCARNAIGTYTLNLQPAFSKIAHRETGKVKVHNLCPDSTPECRSGCLQFAGRLIMPTAQWARTWKTEAWINDRPWFLWKLDNELSSISRRHPGAGVRLNALSDIPWEIYLALGDYDLQFYDYTKSRKRVAIKLPGNYDLTYSISEKYTVTEALALVRNRSTLRAAMVVSPGHDLWGHVGTEHRGVMLTDGDVDDWRPGDPRPGMVLLRPKGVLKKAPAGDKHFVK